MATGSNPAFSVLTKAIFTEVFSIYRLIFYSQNESIFRMCEEISTVYAT